jgi:glycosyltransferase involved in cell wall biosynthesis
MTEFATGLVSRGHEVTVLTTDVLDGARRARPRREVLDGVHVERHANMSNALAWRTKKYLPPGLVLASARRARGFDVVHVTDTRTLATVAGYFASRTASVPLCISAHGSLPGSAGLRGAIKRRYDAVLVRPMLAHAALLLAQTDHEARLYLEAGGREAAVKQLPLPLDLAGIPSTFERGFLRARAGFDAGIPIVLFLGRIHRLKGLDVLADALAPLLRAGEAALAVVGRDDGQWPAIATKHAGLIDVGAIRFIGPLYGQERFHAYADADVFCLTPRHWEETSVASLEAAATGTPVVVTEQADFPGLAEAGGGFVVSLDGERIRCAVEHTLSRSAEMGERARALVEREHSRDVVVDWLEGYLRAVTVSA